MSITKDQLVTDLPRYMLGREIVRVVEVADGQVYFKTARDAETDSIPAASFLRRARVLDLCLEDPLNEEPYRAELRPTPKNGASKPCFVVRDMRDLDLVHAAGRTSYEREAEVTARVNKLNAQHQVEAGL